MSGNGGLSLSSVIITGDSLGQLADSFAAFLSWWSCFDWVAVSPFSFKRYFKIYIHGENVHIIPIINFDNLFTIHDRNWASDVFTL